MPEPHVMSALRDKRAELAGMVNQLEQQLVKQRADLTHVDATMRNHPVRTAGSTGLLPRS